jgi:THO complex subunit 1
MMGIVDDEFDLDMAKEPDEKEAAERSKANKVWRTLRLSARSKLFEFEKIEDGKKINLLFASPAEESKDGGSVEDTSKKTDQQDDSAKEESKDETSQEEPSQENPSSTIPETQTEEPTAVAT